MVFLHELFQHYNNIFKPVLSWKVKQSTRPLTLHSYVAIAYHVSSRSNLQLLRVDLFTVLLLISYSLISPFYEIRLLPQDVHWKFSDKGHLWHINIQAKRIFKKTKQFTWPSPNLSYFSHNYLSLLWMCLHMLDDTLMCFPSAKLTFLSI